MKLTKSQCSKLKPKEKSYKKFDGEGLYLEIKPNGRKVWHLKYRFLGKEKRLSFGSYPLITLSHAREKKRKAKLLLDQGIDPSQAKRQALAQAKSESENCFEAIALEWYNLQLDRWSPKYSQKVLSLFKRDVFPLIGKLPIHEIAPPHLLEILRNIERRGALYEAGRTRQLSGQVFRYAIQTGRCTNNPSIHLQGALKTRKTNHFAAIDTKEIPEFLQTLNRNDARLFARTRRAIKLSMLTFVRPGELRQARWENIDFEDKEWIIPAKFMKMDRDHIVPLAHQSVQILIQQKEETGHINTPWVFPSQVRPQKPMSDGTVNVAIKKLGYHGRMTAHGFRALARTTIREKLKYYPDIIEAQLAHKPMGPLGTAYDRAQFLDERKKMMQDWANYLDDIALKAKKLKKENFK